VGERERGHRLIVGYAATGAAVIIVVHLSGGANGTQGGYVEHPVLRLVGLGVWGALVGATIGWLVRATPSRAVLPLGLGTIVAAIGFLVGLWFAVNVQGQSVIDGNERVQLLSSLEGAGAGWVIGASVGLAFATKEPKPPEPTRGARAASPSRCSCSAFWPPGGRSWASRRGDVPDMRWESASRGRTSWMRLSSPSPCSSSRASVSVGTRNQRSVTGPVP
jgi:hypothetical protein